MNNNSYVYLHKRLDNNEIFYVGIGNRKNFERAYSKYARNCHWHNIVKKCGYEVQITYTGLTWKEACIVEKTLISQYGRVNLSTGTLVNLTDGGDGGFGQLCSTETRKKLSNALKGKLISEDTRKKLSVSATNRVYPEEYREKISLLRKEKIIPKEVRLKMSLSMKKIILNTQTGIYYLGFAEAADSCNIHRETLRAWLRGIYPNRSNFILC